MRTIGVFRFEDILTANGHAYDDDDDDDDDEEEEEENEHSSTSELNGNVIRSKNKRTPKEHVDETIIYIYLYINVVCNCFRCPIMKWLK
jgi:hypothetical protein